MDSIVVITIMFVNNLQEKLRGRQRYTTIKIDGRTFDDNSQIDEILKNLHYWGFFHISMLEI